MDSQDLNKMKRFLNTDVVRRLLIKYFKEKGFSESFDRLLYPGMLQDLCGAIPQLANKVEIEPHAVDVDPTTGKAVIGWNLFVLGNHRMYLGETHHSNLSDLARQIESGMIAMSESGRAAMNQSTPRQVVNFVTRVLSKHNSGYVDLTPPSSPSPMSGFGAARPNMGNGQFFARPKV